ncbi:MAG: PGDYG domain-containing protein [Steroidobacterales bacterium]
MAGARLEHPDLRADRYACDAIKDEVVEVEFAAAGGALASAVGPNAFAAGDALLTGSTRDRWCVSRDRFDAKYRPEAPTVAGQAGRYRNIPAPVRAKQIPFAFTIERSAGGDLLHGSSGDWLLEYAPGDYGVVARARFEAVYRLI